MVSLSIPPYVNWNNVKRVVKMAPYYWGDGMVTHQDALEKLVRGTKDASGKYVGGRGFKNFGQSLRESFLETESAYKGVMAKEGGFCKYVGNTLRKFPSEVSAAWTKGGATAATAGKSALWGSVKGAGSAIGKRLPLIGSLIYAATQIPNIFEATKDGGLVSGGAELLKTGAKITGFTAGCAIGQAICPIPIVGGILGGMVGEWLTGLVVGKSYSEQKEEIQQETAQAMQQQGGFDTGSTNPFSQGVDPQQLQMLQEMVANDPRFKSA